MIMNAMAFTMDDVLDIMDGNTCYLKLILGKQNREKLDQYYWLRARYCKAKFLEKYAHAKAETFADVPDSIKEFWNACDANLQKLVTAGLKFDEFNIGVVDPKHGFSFTIDAIGSVAGIDRALILLCFSGSWRKSNAIKLVAQLNAMNRENKTPVPGALVALLLGKEEDDVTKLYRVVNKENEYAKNGNVKTEGWEMLDKAFEDGVVQAKKTIVYFMAKPLESIPTDPAPINCGTCSFHNTIIDDANGNKTCTGYYHPA